jgi:hypothetical protein
MASPYTHSDPAVREQRFQIACRVTAALLRSGSFIYSPIVHSHPLVAYGLPGDWKYWAEYDLEHLQNCEELLVLTVPGWQESIGVQAEISIAQKLGKPIHYLDPNQWSN